MAFTLRDLLAFEELRAAGPEVLTGGAGLDRPVRWVHSSEIYEIWPLLSGGELLLTTGLGLAGPDAGARRHYVRRLAEVGVAGLALELGRTFSEPPVELVEEARTHGLPLIGLTRVVPFIRISQAANTAIVDAESARMRLGERTSRALNASLTAGAGLSGVLSTAGDLVGCPLVVLSAAGALVAVNGVRDHRAAWTVVDAARLITPIVVHGQVWGRVLAGAGSPLPEADLTDVLERVAVALGLAVLMTGSPPSQQDRQAGALLADLLEGKPGDADFRLRAGMLGFHPRVGQSVLAAAVDGPETGPAQAVLERAGRELDGPRLVGRVGGGVHGLLVVPAPEDGDPRHDAVGRAAAVLESVRSRFGVPELTVALGHAVPAEAGARPVSSSLRAARAALRLAVGERAGRPGGAPAVVTARELALELQLTGSTDTDALRAMARSTLAALIDWDAAHRSELVHTLEVLLQNGNSPTKTAAALHLGRQSLYQRIERIEALLGHDVDEPRLHAALLMAAIAHRLTR
ncbi:PucR family transcriptional regulator [Spongisporangium articulatum]|uniref:PucR family transcriptional regulator n=1 Tax=Spongisporangium articulatum TaxID=3362603 RepID=A0ABW8AQW4_9ACTN